METQCSQTWRRYIHTPCCAPEALFHTDTTQQYFDDPENSRCVVSSDAMTCISNVHKADAPLENPLTHLSAPARALDLGEATPGPFVVTGVEA